MTTESVLREALAKIAGTSKMPSEEDVKVDEMADLMYRKLGWIYEEAINALNLIPDETGAAHE